jgi:phosphatidylserine decarboxylase
VGALRRVLLTALPKVPLPRSLRGPVYRWFSRRYGADLGEMEGELTSFASLARFFQRPLRPGARPVADAALVWPCDGRIVTSGPIEHGSIPQVKGSDYTVAELLQDDGLAAQLASGSQATIYLAPGDYHRVHAPFSCRVQQVRAVPGTLFPVNPAAVRSIPLLFARNARHVFHCRLADGRPAAVVMVGAFNVGGTVVTCPVPGDLQAGDELGRFGFGSTVVVLLPAGAPAFGAVPSETVVRVGTVAALASRR